jgi:hypothetical protein
MTEKYSSIPLLKISVANDLKSSCAGDNFDEFAGDDGLAGAVESDGQFVDHLLCKKRGIGLFGRVSYSKSSRLIVQLNFYDQT